VEIVRLLYRAGRLVMGVFVCLWAVVAGLTFVNHASSSAQQQRAEIETLADENRLYCERWGFSENTHAFNLCTLDLDEVRQNERERMLAVGF
jgi:hypothetical protein